jgi:peptidoglycan hydrolase-like protein with peptidoglycan-binding domain
MPSWFIRELSRGMEGPDIFAMQRLIKMVSNGVFDRETEAHVRAVQLANGLRSTGVVDADTAEVIGELERHGLVPDWFSRPLGSGDSGEDVERLRWLLGLPRAGVFDEAVEVAVRQYQSAHGITPDGTVNKTVATMLGEEVPLRLSAG